MTPPYPPSDSVPSCRRDYSKFFPHTTTDWNHLPEGVAAAPPSDLSSPLVQTPRTPTFLPKAHDIISRIIEFGRRIERNRIGSPQDDEEDASIGGRLLSSQPCGALISFEKTEKNTSAIIIIIIIVVVVIIITVLMC